MRDETIEEGAGSALRVLGVFGLGLLKLLVKVAGGLLIEFLMLIEVGCRKWGQRGPTKDGCVGMLLTLLVVHAESSLDLLSDGLHFGDWCNGRSLEVVVGG